MRIAIVSDTHNRHRAFRDYLAIPPADVLIHAGDATMSGTIEEVGAFGNWFANLPHQLKIFVPGNHDFLFEKSPQLARELMAGPGVHVLMDEAINFGFMKPDKSGMEKPLKFYGTPWVPNLEGWAFYGDSQTLTRKFAAIPADTNVLISHGPPWGLLDRCPTHVGSEELARRVHELNLKLHCFGHIHESYGTEDHLAGRWSVNASSCNEQYQLVNPPIVVEI